VLDQNAEAVRLFCRGAEITDCNWGVDTSKLGPATLLPSLNLMRGLCNLITLDARRNLADGHPAVAVKESLALLIAARQLGKQGMLVSTLVEDGMAEHGVLLIATHAGEFPDDLKRQLIAGIDALPAHHGMAAAIDDERMAFAVWAQRLIREGHDDQMRQTLHQLVGDDEWQSSGLQDVSHAEMTKLANGLDEDYKEGIRIAGLPYAQWPDAAEKYRQTIHDGSNPLSRMMIPGFGKALLVDAFYQTHIGMLKAGLVLMVQGQDAFGKRHDPYGQGAFTLQNTVDGFTVLSQLKDEKGKIVEVTFHGKPKSATASGR